MNEVRIYNPQGKLKKIITEKQLEERGDMILNAFAGHSTSYVPRQIICLECKKEAWAKHHSRKFCSKTCSDKSFNRGSRERKKKLRLLKGGK